MYGDVSLADNLPEPIDWLRSAMQWFGTPFEHLIYLFTEERVCAAFLRALQDLQATPASHFPILSQTGDTAKAIVAWARDMRSGQIWCKYFKEITAVSGISTKPTVPTGITFTDAIGASLYVLPCLTSKFFLPYNP